MTNKQLLTPQEQTYKRSRESAERMFDDLAGEFDNFLLVSKKVGLKIKKLKKHIEEDQFCACGNIKMDESEFCKECV